METSIDKSKWRSLVLEDEPGVDVKGLSEDRPEDLEKAEDGDPCWDGYEQVGMKQKNGREVPNCVPLSKSLFSLGGALYYPALVNGEFVLAKASRRPSPGQMSLFDISSPRQGERKTINGTTYVLNQNSRWEREDDASPAPVSVLPILEDDSMADVPSVGEVKSDRPSLEVIAGGGQTSPPRGMGMETLDWVESETAKLKPRRTEAMRRAREAKARIRWGMPGDYQENVQPNEADLIPIEGESDRLEQIGIFEIPAGVASEGQKAAIQRMSQDAVEMGLGSESLQFSFLADGDMAVYTPVRNIFFLVTPSGEPKKGTDGNIIRRKGNPVSVPTFVDTGEMSLGI